jgi:ketosteroid isomerase-like protein
MNDASRPEHPDFELAEVIRRYLEAHDRGDTDGALAAFTRDATVVDDGHDYVGSDEIRHWLSKASTEFTYTRTFVDADAVDANTWLVTNHLEGNFPGNVVDLRYQFVLTGDLISELIIAP